MPSDPIDEEEDVAAFLLHHGLEGVDQLGRERAGGLRGREQAESEEAVDALAVAGDHEGPFGIPGTRVGGLRRERDAVGLDEIREHVMVAALLEAVEFDRLAQERIENAFGIGADVHARAVLRLDRDVPDGERSEARLGLGLELRPVEHGGAVGVEGGEQHLAEEALMLLAAEADRAVAHGRAGGRDLREGQRRHGSLRLAPVDVGGSPPAAMAPGMPAQTTRRGFSLALADRSALGKAALPDGGMAESVAEE